MGEIDTSKWPPEVQAAYKEAQAALSAENAALDKATASATAAASSPEAALLALRVQTDEARRKRERIERETADERAWMEAQAKYGARCRRVYTESGSLILVGTDKLEAQWEAVQARAENVSSAFLTATPPDPARAIAEGTKALRLGHLDHLIAHPSKEEAKTILKTWPGAWDDVYAARRDLFRGAQEALGKGVAS